ncbi:MAG: glycosyltransferase family 1 protein [Pedosphaera sp.]|nr:glycosyltransferase family 1 protein [Pedosphaera sp.]
MRFLFLTLGYSPDIDGGGYRYATEVAELLAGRGHEVHAVFPNPGNQFPAREIRKNVSLHRLPKAGGGFLQNFRAANHAAYTCVRELLEASTAPTLVFSHHAYLDPALATIPFVMILQGPWALEHRYSVTSRPRTLLRKIVDSLAVRQMQRVERKALQGARHVFVASEYSRNCISTWHPGLHRIAEVIGGGADFQRFCPPSHREAIRHDRGLSEGDFLFLAVRRLDPRMGLLHLVDGFASVVGRFPNARLWIAGKGNQKTELESRISAAGLSRQIRMLGFVAEDELPRLYGAADAVLMPALDLEGFGLATAEALACGTPVLASAAGANPELIRPLGERLLFEPASTVALARALEAVLDGELQLPARQTCADYARSEFRWDRPADAIERAHATYAITGWPPRSV